MLQKSFSSKNSAGHPDCYVTNRPRNFRQSFILVAQSMETTPEKMFFFPKKTCFLAKIFFGPLKIRFKNSAKHFSPFAKSEKPVGRSLMESEN